MRAPSLCISVLFCSVLVVGSATTGTVESPAAFLLDAATAGTNDGRLAAIMQAAGAAARTIIAAKHAFPARCVASADRWLRVESTISGIDVARFDQRASLVGNVWLPCIKATAVELLADGAPLAVLSELAESAKALSKHVQTPGVPDATLHAAAMRFGAAVLRVADTVSERSIVFPFAESVLKPLGAALTNPAFVHAAIADWRSSPPPPPGMDLLYWRFVPPYAGKVTQAPFTSLNFKSRCFGSISVSSSVKEANKKIDVTVTATEQNSTLCIETMLFFAGGALSLDVALWEQLFHTKAMIIKGKNPTLHDALWWDATTMGVRVFYSMEPIMSTIASAIETFALYFGPMVTDSGELSAVTELDVALMMNTYLPLHPAVAQPAPAASSSFTAASFAASLHSGDVLAITRLDGIDALWNWAQGENIAHLAVALCNGACVICESRAESAYWLTANGVQCHDAQSWFKLAANVSLNVVKLPLTDTSRAGFDTAAALSFAEDHLEIDYGYQTWAYASMDTHTHNFPCFPTRNWSHCITFEHVEIPLIIIDNILPSISSYFFGEGLNNRLFDTKGSFGMPVVEALEYAYKNKGGMTAMDVIVIPEEDGWPYYTTRGAEIYNGTVFTTSSFVCNALRIGGAINGAPFECAEGTPFEVFALAIYNASAVVQVLGDYALFPAPQFNSRAPYPDMGNGCPASPPSFLRPDQC